MSASPTSPTESVARPSDRVRALLVLLLALVEVAAAPVASLFVGADRSTGAVSDRYPSPITPPGYAFAIWGLIYLGMIIYAVYQLLPRQLGRRVHRRTGWWMVAAMACSTGWVPIFAAQQLIIAQLVIIALVVFLIIAVSRLHGTAADGVAEQTALRMPVGLYLGWATVAAAAGFGTTLAWLGLPPQSTAAVAIGIALLVLATAVCVVMIIRVDGFAGVWFTAAWAIVSLVIGAPATVIQVVAVVAIAGLVVAMLIRVRRSDDPAQTLFG